MSVPVAAQCRILPYEAATGPANMALDEALLNSVAEGRESAVLRTYGWTEATLSLGYFQNVADALREPRWQGVPLVRRPTGGGALWHHHEVTYALVLPSHHPLARRSTDLYRTVHAAIGQAVRDMGLVAERRGNLPGAEARSDRPFLCFADRDAEDLLAGGIKIVGSAQRRRRGAVLQHGALIVARSERTPELPGLAELGCPQSNGPEWSARWGATIPAALGLQPEQSQLTSDELGRAARLEREVYRNLAWTLKR